MAQIEILQRLQDEPGVGVNDVARRHRLANNTVSSLVQQLVLADLITRDPLPTDRRAVQLNLTPEGIEVLAAWQAAHERRFEAALNRLERTDRSAVLAALPALSRLVDELEAVERANTTDNDTATPMT